MKITVLGSGTSHGIPVITCQCSVCTSANKKDNRLRSSILIEIEGKNIVVDTGPDFRQQMLVNNICQLDAVLFTHEHNDHIAGLDDIRAFNYKQKKNMDIYCSKNVKKALQREFHYVFSDFKYPGTPSVNINLIENKAFKLFNSINITPIEVMHYKLPVFGFRINDFTYITDAKTISDLETEKVKGTEILILNCLRTQEHLSHFNLDEAVNFINKIKPKHTYLTHISHLFGTHEEIQSLLPKNVSVAYDGLSIRC